MGRGDRWTLFYAVLPSLVFAAAPAAAQHAQDDFDRAVAIEERGEPTEALGAYKAYLEKQESGVHRQEAHLKVKMIEEAIARDDLPTLKIFLSALAQRKSGDLARAIETCEDLLRTSPGSR